MGKPGQPVDGKAEKARRKLARQLLDRGLPPRTVARQCGRSYSWVYQLRKEIGPLSPETAK
jgi:hypothetical protein